jgi:hypothetical protein
MITKTGISSTSTKLNFAVVDTLHTLGPSVKSYPKCIIVYKNQRTQNLKKPTHNDIKKTSNNDDQYNNFKKILLNDQCNPFEQDFVERPMQPI